VFPRCSAHINKNAEKTFVFVEQLKNIGNGGIPIRGERARKNCSDKFFLGAKSLAHLHTKGRWLLCAAAACSD
jgi:hypothetical protein